MWSMQVATLVGDTSLVRSAAFTQATTYSAYSASVVGSVARYTAARSRYDARYIHNHTAGVREELRAALRTATGPLVKAANMSFAALFPGVDALVACVSMRPPSTPSAGGEGCGAESVRARFEEVMGALGAQLDATRGAFSGFATEGDKLAANMGKVHPS